MKFKEYLQLLEDNTQGTYVCTHVNQEHAKIIIDTLEKYGIKNLVHPEELHVTIIYSKTPCPIAYNLMKVKDFTTWFHPNRFEIFGEEEKVLVIRGWSDTLENINKKLMTNGATSDYDGYNPHITVALDTDIDEIVLATMDNVMDEVRQKLSETSTREGWNTNISLEKLTVKPITNAGHTVKMNDGKVIQK